MRSTPWRLAGGVLAAAAAVALVSTPYAVQAAEYSVQKRDYRFKTFFEVAFEGAAVATVQRQHWRQPLQAHYVLYSTEGYPLGQATTRLLSLGAVFPWAKTLDIADADGTPLMCMTGDFFTAETARYRLNDPNGQTLAILHIDQMHTSCLVASPDNPFAIMARYYRNRLCDDAAERWEFTTVATGPVPDIVWHLVGAFLADSWS